VIIDIQTNEFSPLLPVRPGNVYPCRGGRLLKEGSMFVLLHVTRNGMGLLLTINREGEPIGVSQYGMHCVEEWTPIAFVEGIENLSLVMTSI